mmetsp:Transcript_21166/g.38031  ORF Transcript_21166/g.38031 Transcript_21166/m.38031 type:complete len:131 (-) Transcript_21166:3-395(-)
MRQRTQASRADRAKQSKANEPSKQGRRAALPEEASPEDEHPVRRKTACQLSGLVPQLGSKQDGCEGLGVTPKLWTPRAQRHPFLSFLSVLVPATTSLLVIELSLALDSLPVVSSGRIFVSRYFLYILSLF